MNSKEQKRIQNHPEAHPGSPHLFRLLGGIRKPKPEAHEKKASAVSALFEIKPTLFCPILVKKYQFGWEA